MVPTIRESWDYIEEFIRTNNPNNLPALNPPATPQQLEQLEKGLGLKLPNDLVESLKIHNGELLTLGLTLSLDCERIKDEYDCMMNLLKDFPDYSRHSPDQSIQDVFWDKNWIPIAADGGGNLWCIDMNPTSKGTQQQVIFWDHEGSCDVEAQTLASFLMRQVDEIGNGAEWLEDDGVLSVEY